MQCMREQCLSDQLIAQAELLPVIAARIKWEALMKASGSRRVLYFLDNDSARFGLIKGYSPTQFSAWLLTEAWRQDEQSGAMSWFERVPSKSNCADGPSRLDFTRLSELLDGNVSRVDPPKMWEELHRRHKMFGR